MTENPYSSPASISVKGLKEVKFMVLAGDDDVSFIIITQLKHIKERIHLAA